MQLIRVYQHLSVGSLGLKAERCLRWMCKMYRWRLEWIGMLELMEIMDKFINMKLMKDAPPKIYVASILVQSSLIMVRVFFWILLITFCSVTWDFRVLLFAHCGDLSLLCLVTSFHLVPCAVSGGVTVGHEAFRGDATYFHSIQVGSDPCIIIKTFCSRPRASQW